MVRKEVLRRLLPEYLVPCFCFRFISGVEIDPGPLADKVPGQKQNIFPETLRTGLR
jgi:hypothetical protein